MTRAELIRTLATYPVGLSIDGSTPHDLTPALAERLAHDLRPLRVMDVTILPQAIREQLEPDGSILGATE